MKTITLTANNRPEYLASLLSSLAANELSGFTLHVGIEPGNPAVLELCRQITFMKTELHFNNERLGVRRNPFSVLERAFEAGSEFNVALEDDLVLSPDALSLANWFYHNHSHSIFAINLLNYESKPHQPTVVRKTKHFIPLGWATSRFMWEQYIKHAWFSDQRGWDFSINKLIEQTQDLVVFEPMLSRSNHIGREGGTHCSSEYHDNIFGHLAICTKVYETFTLQ